MSKRWEKEDRAVWENSEVMRELESKVLENIAKIKAFAETKVFAETEALATMGPEAQQTFNSLSGKPGEQGAFLQGYEGGSPVLDAQLGGSQTNERLDEDLDSVTLNSFDLNEVPGTPRFAYIGGVEYDLTDDGDLSEVSGMDLSESGVKVLFEAAGNVEINELEEPGVVIGKLREVLKKASDAKNYTLAYKIERIIDELNEEEL